MFVLSVGIANMVGECRVQWNELMAASVVAVVPVMVLYSLLERHGRCDHGRRGEGLRLLRDAERR